MPKFGELQAADPWSSTTRTLTAFNAQSLFDLPIMDANYPGVTPSSSASADTYGSWLEVVANVGNSKRLLFAYILPRHIDANYAFEIEFGEGASGSEAAVARINGRGNMVSLVSWVPGQLYPIWKSLTNGARLSVRAKDNLATARDVNVSVMIA